MGAAIAISHSALKEDRLLKKLFVIGYWALLLRVLWPMPHTTHGITVTLLLLLPGSLSVGAISKIERANWSKGHALTAIHILALVPTAIIAIYLRCYWGLILLFSGFAMNTIVMVKNHYLMPITREAMVTKGWGPEDISPRHSVANDETKLYFLIDRFTSPLLSFDGIPSLGDILAWVGASILGLEAWSQDIAKMARHLF